MEHYHFSWVNQLSMAILNSFLLNYQRVFGDESRVEWVPTASPRQERKTRNESDLIINDGDAIDDDPGNQKSFFFNS